MPERLRGRARPSTLILAVVFVVTLVAYFLVRPAPVAVGDPQRPATTRPSAPTAPASPEAGPRTPTESPSADATGTPGPPTRSPEPTATEGTTPTTEPSSSTGPTP